MVKAVKNKKIIFLFILVIISSFVIYKNYLKQNLSNFSIEKIIEQDSLLYLYMTPSKNAVSYKVLGYNKDNNLIFENESKTNILKIDNLKANYNEEISFKAIAYNKNENSKESLNQYEYIVNDLSFSNLEKYSVKDRDYIIFLNGKIKNNEYKIDIYFEDILIKTLPVTNNILTINKEILNDLSGIVTLKLVKDDKREIDTFNIYANSPVVGDIKITNLKEENNIIWDDLYVKYEGGGNATNLIVNLFQDGVLKNSYETTYNPDGIFLPVSLFEENMTYQLKLIAIYKNYLEIAKKDSVMITIGEKEMVSPVYVNYNYKNIKKNTLINLKTNTNNAVIYYTIDGSEPNVNSLVYKEPILIQDDITIKTKAVRQNMFDSVVNTYNFHVEEKPLVVYLSPSNQTYNHGVSSVGFTTEMQMMNKLTDYLKPYLESYGVKVYRNNPNTDINTWLNESNYVKSDLHLAIHSNGSSNHDAHGIEMYVDNENSNSLSIANKIYENLYEIYPYKDQTSKRGIKYSRESLGEANDEFIKCGTLIEIAYHDEVNDAKWIVDNLESIAKNIGDSILEYYQIK